jgi:hypothetical protein
MKNRWMALAALPLIAACARGGEDDQGAVLMDSSSSAPYTGDTAVAAPAAATAPVDSMPMDSAAHAAMDSTVPGDSAAHP